jgi:hypothetical protein
MVGVLFCLLLLSQAGRSQQTQSASGKDIVSQAVKAELAADAADHTKWIYFETDKKPGDGTVQWVAQTTFGELARVLEKDGHPLSLMEQRRQMDTFIHDNTAQSKQRKGSQHDDKEATEMLNMLPNAFIWTVTGHRDGTTILHFKPDPNFHSPTWESRVFAAMEGDMAVQDEQHRIVSLKGTMTSEVKFGWGLFGAIEPGGWFQVERRQVAKDLWQITETHVHIQGHALIFKTISEQEDDVKSKFEPLPVNITFQQAEEKLLAQGETPNELSLK